MLKFVVLLCVVFLVVSNVKCLAQTRDEIEKRYDVSQVGPVAAAYTTAFSDYVNKIKTNCQQTDIENDGLTFDKTLCSSLTEYNADNYFTLFNTAMGVYDKGSVCGVDISKISLTPFTVPISLASYPGKCNLVCESTATIQNANVIKTDYWPYVGLFAQENTVIYFPKSEINLLWDGCQVQCTCTQCSGTPSKRVNPLSGVLDLVCQVLLLANQLLDGLVYNLLDALSLEGLCPELEPSGNGGTGTNGGGGSGNNPDCDDFSGGVTINHLVNSTHVVINYYSTVTGYCQAVFLTTYTSFDSGVPAEYQDDLDRGIYYLFNAKDVNDALFTVVDNMYYVNAQVVKNICK